MPIQVLMPALSPTMTEGVLAKWHVKEGDTVSSGDVIAEIETDKATMEVEAVDEGIVGRLLVPAGTQGVAVNTTIALFLEEGESGSALTSPSSMPSPVPTPPPEQALARSSSPSPAQSSAPPSASVAAAAHQPSAAPSRLFASPLARRLAAAAGLDLATLRGSGPHGRIVKADVEAAHRGATAAQSASSAPSALVSTAPDAPFAPPFTVRSHTTMRRVIAQRLSESKRTVPHFYLSVDLALDRLLAARAALNDGANGAFRLSVNDMLIKAAALALHRVPEANASWSEEGLRLYQRADISVAVAIEGGLITPVIRDAGNKGLVAISTEMKTLADKARAGKLMPEDYQGGVFSLSNLGMYGIDAFAAVINPPQACILAVGAGVRKPVVSGDSIVIAAVMTVTLSVDHRAVDGAVGAAYLQAFRSLVEEPLLMLT